jgi:ubiquinone/menaquinone biosynthesis C-methylase UbiE
LKSGGDDPVHPERPSVFDAFLARQLARPSGLFGRHVLGRWLRQHTREVNRWVLEAFPADPGGRLLEIGFGSGELLYEALSRDPELRAAGLDLSAAMVGMASQRLRPFLCQQRVELLQGAVDAIPFADGCFKRLVSVNCVYFWPDPGAALAECRRVLADRGQLLLCFDDKAELRQWRGHAFGFRLYEIAEVEALVQAAGFDRIEVRSRTFPGYGLAHCLSARLG